ncbi:hypothetical protein JJV70_19820 [Streptomyces sp. JJ66]|uniref:hypothetical protein n=1 Tax=Streptomyces sp. JJ66 TaxID=2803843 RepID=UPI001C55ABFF|nr:hypothetical protein [Streptomyces sp. JJ66]MBW1604311.1 hypothetical protein [Streptomyces sp. JJ66]
MTEFLLLLGGLAAFAGLLIAMLLRRGNSRTTNPEGLCIEQDARDRAHSARITHSAPNIRPQPTHISETHHR